MSSDPQLTPTDPAPRDPLLAVVRLALTAGLALCLLAVTALPVALVAMTMQRDRFVARLAESGIAPDALPRIAILMALVASMFALGFFFLRHLRRIVDSVANGDPFVPANADHLKNMAWLALAIQVVIIPATGLLVWFDSLPDKPNVHYVDNNSFGGLVVALLLFVLARVFRVGSAMREELEGTV